jgi:hypothetical protein
LFELDEILVVVLRHLLNYKKSILELSNTSKSIRKRLCSTALWNSLGYLFYKHIDKNITHEMLRYLICERQSEMHLDDFASLHVQPDKAAEKLKFLLTLAEKSAMEAKRMVGHNWLETPLFHVVQWDDNPDVQELTCKLLCRLFSAPDLNYHHGTSACKYVRVLTRLIQNYAEDLGKLSLVLAACKVLSRFSTVPIHETTMFSQLASISPVLIKLMKHKNLDLQAAACTVAGTIACGDFSVTETLVNTPGFWPVITEALSSPRARVRKDAAWTLSNIAAEGLGPYSSKIISDVFFQKLLTLRSDEKAAKEVIWVFSNLLDNYAQMDEDEKHIWQKYFEDLIDFAEKRLVDYVSQVEKLDSAPKMADPTLRFLTALLDIMEEFPNKETFWLPKLALRNLVTLLRSPALGRVSYGVNYTIVSRITGRDEVQPMDTTKITSPFAF